MSAAGPVFLGTALVLYVAGDAGAGWLRWVALLAAGALGNLPGQGVLAENVLSRVPRGRLTRLGFHRVAVVGVTAASLAVAYAGEDAFSLLEGAYEIGLVSLLVPLVAGMASRRGDERSALASMLVGTVL